VLTVADPDGLLPQIGEALLWRGAMPITFERQSNA
jgi:hypothetical protein